MDLKISNYGKCFSITQLISHVRTPLYRNGYALILSSATTSGLGIIYWVLAARYYATDIVGLNSALLATVTLVSGIAQLGLNLAVIRFLPTAGRAAYRLVGYTYIFTVILAILAALIFYLGVGLWIPVFQFLVASPWRLGAFILVTIAWCIFTLQDSVLTGLRQTVWVPIENTIFAVVKIILLIVFAGFFQQYGIFASWTIPVILSLIPINFFIFRHFIPQYIQLANDQAAPIIPWQITKNVVGNYLGSLFYLASNTLLPIIVTVQAGTRANAYFYLPWMIANSLQLVAVGMTTSLTVEAARDQTNLIAYFYRTLVHTVQLLSLAVIVFLIGAPYILHIFGSDYATEGANLLRLLALSTIPYLFIVLYISLARVQNRVGGIIMIQGTLCLLTLSLSYMLLQTFGITGVGLAWLISQTIVASFLILTQLRPILQGRHSSSKQEKLGPDSIHLANERGF